MLTSVATGLSNQQAGKPLPAIVTTTAPKAVTPTHASHNLCHYPTTTKTTPYGTPTPANAPMSPRPRIGVQLGHPLDPEGIPGVTPNHLI